MDGISSAQPLDGQLKARSNFMEPLDDHPLTSRSQELRRSGSDTQLESKPPRRDTNLGKKKCRIVRHGRDFARKPVDTVQEGVPPTPSQRRAVSALEVKQWLPGWDSMEFDAAARRRKPPERFFLFSMDARELRALAGIQRRSDTTVRSRAQETGIQRAHDPARSNEISRFVANGYPWSILREVDRHSDEFDDLRKPGWLPTAIVVNLLTARDARPNGKVAKDELVEVKTAASGGQVLLPTGFDLSWKPSGIHPIEVIDGQHRLWAFDETFSQSYDLPVVAFVGLDISWQAYLFWTINIKPTKINPSLAFDLYPLLRSEDWLERLDGPSVYREARAQELTEVLWAHPESPWHRRINMLGQTRGLGVTQAGWVRSLTATVLKVARARKGSPGGLFTSPPRNDSEPLPWNRTQQAAFLIEAWRAMKGAAMATTADWAVYLRQEASETSEPGLSDEAPFSDRNTYLNTEQGVRAYLTVINDLTFELAESLELRGWESVTPGGGVEPDAVDAELQNLAAHPLSAYLTDLATALADWDWRGADAPGLNSDERALKRAFRGSGGYVEFRRQLLRHLGRNAQGDVKKTANELYRLIKDRK